MADPSAALPLRARPASERPRERLMALGAAALSDAELVAILLGSGSAGRSAVDLVTRLLYDFGAVEGLSRADTDELARHTGVGAAKACRLVAGFALADRVATAAERAVVRTSADIAAVAIPRIGRARTEQVLLLALDGGHRVSRVVDVACGGAASSVMPVREILSLALRHDGVGIAVAHNHPSGTIEPSREDVAVTDRISRGATQVGLRFLDHVIVAGNQWNSVTAGR